MAVGWIAIALWVVIESIRSAWGSSGHACSQGGIVGSIRRQCCLTSHMGQTPRFDGRPATSSLPERQASSDRPDWSRLVPDPDLCSFQFRAILSPAIWLNRETAVWQSFDQGRTIGKSGSETGVILLDEEHADRARITLERDGSCAPFAITCGIFDWMVHTRFFANEENARRACEDMKQALDSIIQSIPLQSDPDHDTKMEATARMIVEFVERYP